MFRLAAVLQQGKMTHVKANYSANFILRVSLFNALLSAVNADSCVFIWFRKTSEIQVTVTS
jgi:hypothetical protein